MKKLLYNYFVEKIYKVIIIGAGPIGLYFAGKCEEADLDFLVVEASDKIGGQLTRLYPEKEIVDIPGIKSIKAKDYIKLLESKINPEKIILNTNICEIKNSDKIEISTGKTHYFCEKLVISTGLGMSVPRPLGIEKENDCDNIIYSIHDYEFLRGKQVVIFGGGDSALDWSKTLSNVCARVHLVHRRTEFRGNPDTIKGCKNLDVHLPFVPHSLNVENGKATSVSIRNVANENEILVLPTDYIFVNFGNVASFPSFPFKMINSFLATDENLVVEKNIFAIGDVSQHENKTRRIAPGNLEADKVFKQII